MCTQWCLELETQALTDGKAWLQQQAGRMDAQSMRATVCLTGQGELMV
jgi:hypothetical protein